MTREEATRHEKEIFKVDESLEKLYNEETIRSVERIAKAEADDCERFRR